MTDPTQDAESPPREPLPGTEKRWLTKARPWLGATTDDGSSAEPVARPGPEPAERAAGPLLRNPDLLPHLRDALLKLDQTPRQPDLPGDRHPADTPTGGEALPAGDEVPPADDETTLARGEIPPVPGEATPGPGEELPGPEETPPAPEETLTGPGETPPASGETAPALEETLPAPEETLPAPEETLPERGGPLPGREPAIASSDEPPTAPSAAVSVFGGPPPSRGQESAPPSAPPSPSSGPGQRAPELPKRGQDLPKRVPGLPMREAGPSREPPLPERGQGPSQPGIQSPPAQEPSQPGIQSQPAQEPSQPDIWQPRRGPGTAPPDTTRLPQRAQGSAEPETAQALSYPDAPLPRRTSRTRPAGRHRSPHRLTVPSDAPSLVLAIPGAPVPATVELAEQIAAVAQLSCPGVDVRIGYLAGDEQRLDDALLFSEDGGGELGLRAVIVPVLAGPHPMLDAMLADVAERVPAPVMLAAHLGPHPLLAEALHARLADAGLARAGRARGLSIVTGINGVLVLADRGEEATQAAGVSAVLLAARLAVPATPASLGDPVGLNAALVRLREAGATQPVIAPCIIGPESRPHEIEAIQMMLGAPSAPPLGAHPAVGQLVAMRYGAALARLAMANSAG